MDARTIFKYLLQAFWLRPESAMWYAHSLTLAKKYLAQFDSPSLEFGCMDGVNSFIMLGGEFHKDFDVYNEVEWDKDSHKKSTLNNDYFDIFNEDEIVLIEKKPLHKFDLGIDWKDSHIRKCERLELYNKLQKIDVNYPVFDAQDNHFRTIWAPNIYWMRNLESVIGELARVLNSDGKLITIAPGPMQAEYMFYKYADFSNKEWLQNLDRGRYENSKITGKSLSEWKKLFALKGLSITKHEMFIPEIIAKTYDIGFRPMFPVFMNMYETVKKISPSDLKDLKKHWVDTVYDLAEPLCVTDWIDKKYPNAEKAWFIFELKKK
jgi:hypothetical protein